MIRLVRLVFLAHWSVPALLALLVGSVAWWFDADTRAVAAAEREIASHPLPAVMDIETFVPVGSGHLPVEVNLRGQWLYEHTVALEKTKSGRVIDTDYLFFLASADDGQTAQAVIVVDEKDRDAVVSLLSEVDRGGGTDGPLFEINGIRTQSAKSSHVEKALKGQNLKQDADFFYIEPFVEGRNVAMARMAKANGVSIQNNPFVWVAVILAGLAALKGFPGLYSRRS